MRLRPFFSYYGGKWRIAPKYPQPRFPVVIEPFAGSAGYSLRYPDRQIVLGEKSPVIAGTWKYLIRTPAQEILRLPDIEEGQDVQDLPLPQEARWLIGWWLTRGATAPNRTLSAWGRNPEYAGQFWGERARQRIASQVDFIRHWKVWEGDYTRLGGTATWFVDPPYQIAGKHYKEQPTCFEALGSWCRSRRGQVMVCENEGASWLPFKPFLDAKANESKTGGKVSKEAIWTNEA